MAVARINEARLRLIKKRQWEPAWGPNYVAAQWAVPREAPAICMPSILYPEKLGGRAFHCLSRNEAWVALMNLYHPGVWELQEQSVMFPQPTPHHLQGHARAQGLKFRPFRGTLDVAERMGRLSKHLRCRVQLSKGEYAYAPFPYLCDLLVFLQDRDGPYLINQSVKDKFEAFRQRFQRSGKPTLLEDCPAVLSRHELEVTYFNDGEVPTRQVVGRCIDEELRANLRDLFLMHGERTSIEKEKRALWTFFQQKVGSKETAGALVRQVAAHLQVDPLEVKTVLMQGIWYRSVQVDLFRPLLMDRPLWPMVLDPIEVYKDWFRRPER